MEEFYFEESNSKHVILKCLIYIFILGIIIGIFFFYKKENTLKTKNFIIEIGTTLPENIDDYIVNGHKNKDKYKLDLNDVDINTVGEYSYKIKYNKHTKKGKIKIVDTSAPNVVLDNITIGVEEEFNPNLLLAKCEDFSLPCSVTFNNEKNVNLLNKAGEHTIEFNISDSQGNSVKKSAIITVSETETLSSKMTNDLEYYSNSENNKELGETLFRKLDKAIYEDTKEYEGMINEISIIDFSEYINEDIYSTKLITAYNKYGYVIGIQVEVTLNDGTKKLIEDKVINSNE